MAYGPEAWRTVAGEVWSFWDLWFCVVCMLDHGGDWASLDTAIATAGGSDAESKWSHLLDLTGRLDRAGLKAADLAGEGVREAKVRAKARTKVLRSHLYDRDMSEPMRNPPSAVMTHRCLFGSWPGFARSPQPFYDKLRRRYNIESGRYDSGWATRRLSMNVDGALSKLVDQAGADPARLLAVRRAALTLYYQAAELCDDSYGALGETARAALEEYARTDWRVTGLAPAVFWRDLLGWCVLASNYGLLHTIEVPLLRWAGAGKDLDLVDATLVELAREFGDTRMRWAADTAQQLRASAVVAAGRLTRFVAIAKAVGAVRWTALDDLVNAAVARRRPDIAGQVLDAAQAAGARTEWLQRRRTEIGAPA